MFILFTPASCASVSISGSRGKLSETQEAEVHRVATALGALHRKLLTLGIDLVVEGLNDHLKLLAICVPMIPAGNGIAPDCACAQPQGTIPLA